MVHRNRPWSKNPQTETFLSVIGATHTGLNTLDPVSDRPPLLLYLKQLWQRRHFVWTQSRARVVTGNDTDKLGTLWLILRPILDALFYYLIFGLLLRMDRGIDNYVGFVIIGVFMYQFTSASLTTGTRTIYAHMNLIRAFNFPRLSLPMADILYDLMQRVPAILVMFGILMIVPPHELPTWSWLLFPAILALQTLLNFGFMLILARISMFFPDITRLMQFISRLLMYGSGVIFPISRLTQNYPTLQAVVEANPIYILLMMYREILMDGSIPDASHWIAISLWAGITFLIGFVVFWLGEKEYGRDRRN